MAVRIQIRRDLSSNWYENDPILYPGEIGFEIDTLKFKVGPLVESPEVGTHWNSILNYANIVPSDSNQTISDFIPLSQLGVASGPAELNSEGNLLIPKDSIIFEGSSDDSFETILSVINPTSDNTISLPDSSGTIALKSDILTFLDTVNISNNNPTDIDSRLLNSFTTAEYTICMKQGSKVRSSKIILQTNGITIDMTEFAITETGGPMSDINISASIESFYVKLKAVITDAETTEVFVKIIKNIV